MSKLILKCTERCGGLETTISLEQEQQQQEGYVFGGVRDVMEGFAAMVNEIQDQKPPATYQNPE